MSLNIRRFTTGIQLQPQTSVTIDTAGEMSFSTSDNRLHYHNGSAALTVASLTGTETLTNKTLTSPIINTPTADTITGIAGGALTLQSASGQNLILQAQGAGTASLTGTSVTVKDTVFTAATITGVAGSTLTVQGGASQNLSLLGASVQVKDTVFTPSTITGASGASFTISSASGQQLILTSPSSNINFNQTILPGTDNTLDIGSASKRVANSHQLSSLLYGSTSGAITLQANASTTSYSIKFPAAQGGASTFLQNDGAGNLSWAVGASGANTSLSNLSSVAINASLLPGTNDSISLGDSTHRWVAVVSDSYSIMNNSSTPVGSIQSNGLLMPDGVNTVGLGVLVRNPNTFGILTENNNSASTNTGSIFLETGNNISASGSYSTGDIVLRTGTKSSGSATRGSIIIKDGSEGTVGHVWTSTNTTGKGQWQSSSAVFQQFISNPVTTQSAVGITSSTYQTFDNSPAFTFTPTISGKYKVYGVASIVTSNAGDVGIVKIVNTTGGASLIAASEALGGQAGSNFLCSLFIQSVFNLTSGTSYVFDIQGAHTAGGGGVYLSGAGVPFYLFAELCG